MLYVIKLGSSVILDEDGRIDIATLAVAAKTIFASRPHHQVVLVTSGAVALGRSIRGDMVGKQIAAGIGQPRLMGIYRDLFSTYGIDVAQVLYTYADIRRRANNAKVVLLGMLEEGVIPIANENDPVVYDELKELSRFGDNAKLAAMIARMIDADRLVLLSDVDGVFSDDPRKGPVKLIPLIPRVTRELLNYLSDEPSEMGRGGMRANVKAAGLAQRAGVEGIIANGKKPETLQRIFQGEKLGTIFPPLMIRGV